MKIIEHEKLVLELVKSFIEKHDIQCDFDYGKTFDVILGEDFREYVLKSWESYKEAGGKIEGIRFIEKDEAKKVSYYSRKLAKIANNIFTVT